jgi:protein-S-isoprenylcysteine O-methyltransferase Ste14
MQKIISALELKIPPAVFVIILAIVMWSISGKVPSLSFSFPGQFVVVVILTTAGILITLTSAVAFYRAQTTVDPTRPEKSSALVTSGIYRVSRNPIYVSFLLILIAWAIYVANFLAFVALPVFVAYMNRFQIIPEERVLRAKFGSTFIQYEQSVRRWL